jgi:hypothetical protein
MNCTKLREAVSRRATRRFSDSERPFLCYKKAVVGKMSNNSFDLENYLYFAIGLKDNDYENSTYY